MTSGGWIGTASELMHTLRSFGVDRDPSGAFHVDGCIVSFMGAGAEYVVGPDAVAYIGKKPVGLVGLLSATSYGMKVAVV